MIRDPYPETVVEVLDDQVEYPHDLLRTVRRFAATGPWSGSLNSRKRKFHRLLRGLARSCGIDEPGIEFRHLDGNNSGASHYLPRDHRIVMVGKLSVVTFLHEFAHALSLDEQGACRWSINLFRECFPRQYSRLIHIGHTLIRPQDVRGMIGNGEAR